MSEENEFKEVKEVKEVKDSETNVAAFFDIDGTLVPMPSLEMRFFSMLRYRELMGTRNYLWWLAEAARLLPKGINQIVHADKMYLRGVRADAAYGGAAGAISFYPEAFERVAWHARRGHLIVLVSGTLELLANAVAVALLVRLCALGITARMGVCATRLEAVDDVWTGRILGEAMFGEAKTRAVARVAREGRLDLSRCFAYGDSAGDKWMLEAVGKPAAVNPSNDLARIARRQDWAVLRWVDGKTIAPRTPSAPRPREAREALAAKPGETGFGA